MTTFIAGKKYNWIGQPERLVYMGSWTYPGDRRTWHRFALVDQPSVVWCEVLETELDLIEETAQ